MFLLHERKQIFVDDFSVLVLIETSLNTHERCPTVNKETDSYND